MVMVGVSAVFGVLLGFSCRVLALVPAILLVLIATVVVDAGAALESTLVHIILAVSTLEFCYLAGAILAGAARHAVSSLINADGTGADDPNRSNEPLVLLFLSH